METTKKIRLRKVLSTGGLVVLALGILMVLSMPQITLTVHAYSHSIHTNHITGWHGAVSSIAEKEIRANEVIDNVRAVDNVETNIDTNNAVVVDDEMKYLTCPKETVIEEEMKC